MAEPETESRMFQCPECDVFFQTSEPLSVPLKPFRLCSRCRARMWDHDDPPRPRPSGGLDYPLFKGRHRPI
jgi:uncharacterized paraquat-inducible protein A